jgi:hypothetical protein
VRCPILGNPSVSGPPRVGPGELDVAGFDATVHRGRGNRHDEAPARRDLGLTYGEHGRYEDAHREFAEALRLHERIDDPVNRAASTTASAGS